MVKIDDDVYWDVYTIYQNSNVTLTKIDTLSIHKHIATFLQNTKKDPKIGSALMQKV